MNVRIIEVTSYVDVLNRARYTSRRKMLPKDHQVSNLWKKKMLISEHSPMRLKEYDIFLEDIPHYVMTHLTRHFIGVIPFVQTSRDDRVDNEIPRSEMKQGDKISMTMRINAQALKNISKVRLCRKADATTRAVWDEVKREMEKVDPVMAMQMVPNCCMLKECPEMMSCGWSESDACKRMSELYWMRDEALLEAYLKRKE